MGDADIIPTKEILDSHDVHSYRLRLIYRPYWGSFIVDQIATLLIQYANSVYVPEEGDID